MLQTLWITEIEKSSTMGLEKGLIVELLCTPKAYRQDENLGTWNLRKGMNRPP